MRKSNIGWGIVVGALLTSPLIALMYLANQVAGLSFIPFDLFNWITKVLPGPVITFGIDLMIDLFRLLRINVANAAKTAEQMIAVFNFFILGTLIGVGFFVYASRAKEKPGIAGGLLAGALFGLPMIAVSVGVGTYDLIPAVNILWLVGLFATWGLLLSWTKGKLLKYEDVVSVVKTESRDVQRLNRRQFLITLGAASASITVVGTGLTTILERSE